MFKLNKYTLMGVFLLPIMLFSACIPAKKTEQTQKQVKQEMQEMAKVIESGGSAYCKLTIDDSNEVLEYWLKGKKMKAKGLGFSAGMVERGDELEKKTGYMISDTEYTYIWSEGDKEGIKMKLPTEEEIKEMAEEAEEFVESMPDFTSEEVVEEYEDQGYKVDCKKQKIGDAEFIPPGNVKFQDMSEMMEAATQMGEKMMKDSGDADMEEIKKMAEEMEEKFGN